MDEHENIDPESGIPLVEIQVESNADVLEGMVRENETYILSKPDNYESDTGQDDDCSNAYVQTTDANSEPAG